MEENLRVAGGPTTRARNGARSAHSAEVATTPGTTADIGRTIQTLPGVQSVDEGNAIFVRGGDYLETKTFVNDALLLTGFRYDNPTGTFSNTPNAFLLDGIFFSSGGFGARFGNALSGVVSLRTLGRPPTTTGTLSAGLGALSAGGAWAPSGTGYSRHAHPIQHQPDLLAQRHAREYDPSPNGVERGAGERGVVLREGASSRCSRSPGSPVRSGQEQPTSGTIRSKSRNPCHRFWRDGLGVSQTASLAWAAATK